MILASMFLVCAIALLCVVLVSGGCERLAGGLLAVSIAFSASHCFAVDESPIAPRHCQGGACPLPSARPPVPAVKPSLAAVFHQRQCVGNQCDVKPRRRGLFGLKK